MKVIVAITAASGAIYARQTIELLLADPRVEQVAMIYSPSARKVALHEGVTLPHAEGDRLVEFDNENLFCSVASGSARWDSMLIVPCSVGTLGRIASGVSDSLIARAADVMLKERRPLILVVRESPLSLIHLRNMTTLTEAGAVIMPASPSYYMGEQSLEEVALSISSRAVSMAGADGNINSYKPQE